MVANVGRASIDLKMEDVRSHFGAHLGKKIIRYETAELLLNDGTWDNWSDLPIRLYTGVNELVAISWSRSDDLWLADDLALPFSTDGSSVRWVENRIEKINPAIGGSIGSIMLGQGDMSLGGRPFEIWTRLLIQLDTGWLEVFNAGDENGYDFHAEPPNGNLIPCIARLPIDS
jgi:hypothetical protein